MSGMKTEPLKIMLSTAATGLPNTSVVSAADGQEVGMAMAGDMRGDLDILPTSSALGAGSGQFRSAEKRQNAKTAVVDEASFIKIKDGVA